MNTQKESTGISPTPLRGDENQTTNKNKVFSNNPKQFIKET